MTLCILSIDFVSWLFVSTQKNPNDLMVSKLSFCGWVRTSTFTSLSCWRIQFSYTTPYNIFLSFNNCPTYTVLTSISYVFFEPSMSSFTTLKSLQRWTQARLLPYGCMQKQELLMVHLSCTLTNGAQWLIASIYIGEGWTDIRYWAVVYFWYAQREIILFLVKTASVAVTISAILF